MKREQLTKRLRLDSELRDPFLLAMGVLSVPFVIDKLLFWLPSVDARNLQDSFGNLAVVLAVPVVPLVAGFVGGTRAKSAVDALVSCSAAAAAYGAAWLLIEGSLAATHPFVTFLDWAQDLVMGLQFWILALVNVLALLIGAVASQSASTPTTAAKDGVGERAHWVGEIAREIETRLAGGKLLMGVLGQLADHVGLPRSHLRVGVLLLLVAGLADWGSMICIAATAAFVLRNAQKPGDFGAGSANSVDHTLGWPVLGSWLVLMVLSLLLAWYAWPVVPLMVVVGYLLTGLYLTHVDSEALSRLPQLPQSVTIRPFGEKMLGRQPNEVERAGDTGVPHARQSMLAPQLVLGRQDRSLLGVIGGLGETHGWNPTATRFGAVILSVLLLVFLFPLALAPLFCYVMMWVVMADPLKYGNVDRNAPDEVEAGPHKLQGVRTFPRPFGGFVLHLPSVVAISGVAPAILVLASSLPAVEWVGDQGVSFGVWEGLRAFHRSLSSLWQPSARPFLIVAVVGYFLAMVGSAQIGATPFGLFWATSTRNRVPRLQLRAGIALMLNGVFASVMVISLLYMLIMSLVVASRFDAIPTYGPLMCLAAIASTIVYFVSLIVYRDYIRCLLVEGW